MLQKEMSTKTTMMTMIATMIALIYTAINMDHPVATRKEKKLEKSIFRVSRLLKDLSSHDDYGSYWENSSRRMPYLDPVWD